MLSLLLTAAHLNNNIFRWRPCGTDTPTLFVDLDPSVFPFVLEWYRHGSPVFVPYGQVTVEAVEKAFDFINIKGTQIKYTGVPLEALEEQVTAHSEKSSYIDAWWKLGRIIAQEVPSTNVAIELTFQLCEHFRFPVSVPEPSPFARNPRANASRP